MGETPKLTVPPKLRRGDGKRYERSYIDGGRDLLNYVTGALGIKDLSDCRVLDMGCGTKFTQALLEYDIPIKKYVGVDIYYEMIDFLESSVKDDRFSFVHMDIHNEMYNPTGKKLDEGTELPLKQGYFDVISLFSVFTHIVPEDYHNMLRMLRPYIKDTGRIIFSLYIEELTHNGFGLIERVTADIRDTWKPSGKEFFDGIPDKPLQWAIYSRKHALELIQGTGWEIEELRLPNSHVQHHIICRPV